MKKIFGKNSLIYIILFAVLIFFGLFLFSIDKDRRAISMSADNIHILLNNTKWTTNNIELTVKYDGDASKHIDSYSFDGGVSWTKSNILILDDNKELSILVKDILGRMYSVNYNVDNIDKEGPKVEVEKAIKVFKNSKLNIKDYIKVTDDKSGVKSIKITPKKINTEKIGKYKVKVVAYDNLDNKTTKKFNIEVVKKGKKIIAKYINCSTNPIEINVNQTKKVNVKFYPRITTNKKIKIKSNDKKIIKVIENKIKALKKGSTSIDIETNNGIKTKCDIKVN